MFSWVNHSSHNNTINIRFLKTSIDDMKVGKSVIRRNLSLIFAGVLERSPRRRIFQYVSYNNSISWYIWRVRDPLQNEIREVCISSEIRSYFHHGMDIKVRLKSWPGPYAGQFFFLERHNTFIEKWRFLLFLLFPKATLTVWLHWWTYQVYVISVSSSQSTTRLAYAYIYL